MKDQHTLISGYRDLTGEEIALMNEAKDLSTKVGAFVERLAKLDYKTNGKDGPTMTRADGRWLAIGVTDLQKGFMAVIRSIAKPSTF